MPPLIHVVVLHNCLAHTKTLSQNLKSRYPDVITTYNKVGTVINTVSAARNDMYEKVDEWFIESEHQAASVDVQASVPQHCSRQMLRVNIVADSPLDNSISFGHTVHGSSSRTTTLLL